MSTAVYRARSATELVDGAVSLLRRNFSVFVTLGAVYYVPILIAQWLVIGAARPFVAPATQITQFYGTIKPGPYFGLLALLMVPVSLAFFFIARRFNRAAESWEGEEVTGEPTPA